MVLLFHTLFPIFGLIGLGYLLVRFGFFDEHIVRGFNSLVYWIGLPCLLVVRLVQADYSTGGFLWISLSVVVATLLTILLAWAAARGLGLQREYMGTFLQASFRGNLAFIGIPVVGLTFLPYGGEVQQQMETLTVLALAPLMLFFNLGSTLVLIAGQPGEHQKSWRLLFLPLLKNPILISAALGVAIGMSGFVIPDGVFRMLNTLVGTASPLALMCIGSSLFLVSFRGKIRFAVLAAIFKTMIAPLAGLLVVWLMGIEGHMLFVAIVMLCCPTATVSYVFTRQLGGDEALASSSIVISSLISFFTLSLLIVVTGMIGMEQFLPPVP